MASGFGRGKVGRCYNLFSTFEKCMNQEEDSSLCYGFREKYFSCLHLPTVHNISEGDMRVLEDGKDTLVLASKALDSGRAPPVKTPGGGGGGGEEEGST